MLTSVGACGSDTSTIVEASGDAHEGAGQRDVDRTVLGIEASDGRGRKGVRNVHHEKPSVAVGDVRDRTDNNNPLSVT